ncbi:MAG: hypothetical protein CBC13_05730 [Planctomycetia bacterium TMED53]|nr:MAG: hypothetical protein CBC13_05730 [Planctomycetia bacterium TMED53]
MASIDRCVSSSTTAIKTIAIVIMFVSVLPAIAGTFLEDDAAQERTPTPEPAWCDIPVEKLELPTLKIHNNLPKNFIDFHWLTALEEAGITPAPEAEPEVLLRRLHYVLTGLPPTPEEVQAFLNSEVSGRWERQVDQLLASEQFGVHWARHWLDLVRWAETDGYERDRPKPNAWKYRDWVVDAFNADMPYDRFLTEQLAGDEIDEESLSSHIATGFLHLGIRDDESADPNQAIYNDFDSMLDTTCRSMLGISMGCARCHDHKGDPIPIRDYYRMLSFFEGLKPYDDNAGNAISTDHFTRWLPADLGTSNFDAEITSWKTRRSGDLKEVENLVNEIKARWGEDAASSVDPSLLSGLVLKLDFDTPDIPRVDVKGEIKFENGRDNTPALKLTGRSHLSIPRPVENDFTISFWFKTDRKGSGNGDDRRWFLGTGLVDGELNGVLNDYGISLLGSRVAAGTGNPETFVSGPKGMVDNLWHHVCFTRNQTTGQIALWIDGTKHLPEDERFAQGSTQPLTAPDRLLIGRLLKGGASYNGLLDDLCFWDRTLTDAEIESLHQGRGLLPEFVEVVKKHLGTPESLRMKSAVNRIFQDNKPTRELVYILSAQEVSRAPVSHVRERGNFSSPGEIVTPGFPEFLGGEEAAIIAPEDGETSGRRLALAKWLTDPRNPRTARVFVNRLWQHIFGSPIVGTPNDFGVFGLPPSHPELLDAMALELVENNWSMKHMIRQLVTSMAFRISGEFDSVAAQIDPVNKLYWRFPSRRLSAEEIRDSVLAVSGNLSLELTGPSVHPPMPKEILATASRPNDAWNKNPDDPLARRRSIYIEVKRSLLHPLLLTFDLADTDTSCPVRFNTVQPTQALTLLNSEFSQVQATRFAERLNKECSDLRSKVQRGLELATQKSVSESTIDRHFNFLLELRKKYDLDETKLLSVFCLTILNLNEFVFID